MSPSKEFARMRCDPINGPSDLVAGLIWALALACGAFKSAKGEKGSQIVYTSVR